MTNDQSRRVWPLLVIALLSVGLYVYFTITIKIKPAPSDRRPPGGAQEIEALAARDDTNLLFILVDTLRSERMSTYGYERQTTPFLDGLAKQGIRFGWNTAQSSWTKSSMASLWTSRTPLRAGTTKFDDTLSKELVMPAEILSDSGFKTVGLFRNGWVNPSFGFDQGFERYYKPLGGYQDPAIKRVRPNAQLGGTDESIVADATEFLRIHGHSSRWFLYIHLMDVHEYTYDKESAQFGTSVSDIYDNSILREDWVISTLHDFLKRLNLLEKTIVVLASDHGEAFGERGYEGHAREVFPETTETPVIISLPFKLSQGIVLPTRTTNMDIWPTLFDLLGLPAQGTDIDGRSRLEEILALARGEAGGRGEDAQAELSVAFLDENWGVPGGERLPAISLVSDEFRYVRGSDWNGRPIETLLSVHEGQRDNVIEAHPDEAENFRKKAEEFLEQEAAFQSEVLELDEMQLDQLRALGYQLP